MSVSENSTRIPTRSRASEVPVARDSEGEGATLMLVSIGHFFSHYYALLLPPLFPFLKAEFGVTYLQLGLAMTAYGLLGGVAQAPVGFLVDRIGPRTVLLVGLGMNTCAVLLMGFADSYWLLLFFAVLAGLGNSVFHPADYAILNSSIKEKALGRAFSIHTFAGFLGGACAPVSVLVLAQWTSWRTALIIAGLAGLVALATMVWQRSLLGDASPTKLNEDIDSASARHDRRGVRLLLSLPVLLFLLFFILYGMSSGGLIAFIGAGLVKIHHVSLTDANTALSAHLFGVVAGILMAGVIASRFTRHMVTATCALLLAAGATALVVVVPSSPLLLIALLTASGVGLGAVLPARDLMIRALAPPGEVGKVFGFVFVGYSIGLSAAPILFGWFLDIDRAALVFVLAAACALLALLAIARAHSLTAMRTLND
ncbi:MAG: FSR family fosmidomycin resistance protein-like MFS transporter [Gammaproteobacteria bacterium]